ncbi:MULTISPECIES: indolepyruvate oxidoreductase subunit beta [Anaerolinea]|jgi:indolepyruvate ferredoxin oxidoreductase beta subunit|uniref:indolepyruvate oxidoreductase subunit beta n=1 Tax=Anaerolinea TaxID=233189 RepID=UPI0026162888|nr:indolepyruvate oxidoreductase subunit beta [Anaerolinea thermophila]
MENHRFVLVGVGGQGTILASNLLAEIGLLLGLDVKKAEIHGMSQRGGSVVSNVVWGNPVYSPVIGQGEADTLIAFEKLEALRYLPLLKLSGRVFINCHKIEPITVSSGKQVYPGDTVIENALRQRASMILWIPANEIAEKIGNIRVANSVMIGAVLKTLEIDFEYGIKALEKVIQPQYRELNLQALTAGFEWQPE